MEVFDLTADDTATTLTLGHAGVFQARDADLVILADADDTVRLETGFNVTNVETLEIDGNTYDRYQVGDGGWANFVLIDADTTFDVI